MHSRQHKRDDEATKAAAFLSKYSYISHRVHPESDPAHQCQYLAGDDCGVMRDRIFKRDEHRCVVCGKWVPKEGDIWKRGHIAHLGGNTKVTRCWCPEALALKCYDCHIVVEHGREPRWSIGVGRA
jgi:hypothetical protein